MGGCLFGVSSLKGQVFFFSLLIRWSFAVRASGRTDIGSGDSRCGSGGYASGRFRGDNKIIIVVVAFEEEEER